jgi:hypothetical protein
VLTCGPYGRFIHRRRPPRARHADISRNHPRRGQRHLHLHPRQQAAGTRASARTADRPVGGDDHAHPAAAVDCLDHPADRAALSRVRSWDFRARFDPDRRRVIPAREGDHRDSRQARRRGGTRVGEGGALVRRGHFPDHAARHRLFARFGDHRGRDGRRRVDHDCGGRACRRGDDVLGRPDQRLRQPSSDGQGAGAVVPAADRRVARRRRPRRARAEGLHLFRDGLLGVRRDDQSESST